MASDLPTHPEERITRLRKLRAVKMTRSAHAYVRGSTDRFYAWLDQHGSGLPSGPDVWICGDCHVGNMGPVGRCEGAAVVELRDLDQTVIGNPAYDLVRLGLSLAMAARSSDLPGITTAHMTEELIAGYEASFEGDVPSEDITELPEPIQFVMKRALKRSWNALRKERLEGEMRLPLGRRFWPLTDQERAAVEGLVEKEETRRLITSLECRDDDARIRMLDAAYWVKGCSSLGLWRVAALVEVRDREKHRAHCLIDIKEAVETWAPKGERAALPRSQAERVVTGARKIAPALGARMVATEADGHSVFVRELLPQDLKVELDELSAPQGRGVARYLGMVVGRAHARQLSPDARARWLAELQSRRPKDLDAPQWLWQAVVDLVAEHERAYLEHCRRYALEASRQPATRA